MIGFNQIGTVKSRFKEKADPFAMREEESIIEINGEFEEGLFSIEDSEFLEVLFYFHLSKGFELKINNYYGEYKGVFATRSPNRPSGIGSSKVKLLRREGGKLFIKGLDAVDMTPVLDIKPYNAGAMGDDIAGLEMSGLKDNPRNKIIRLVKNNKPGELLILAGALHGHFCPGLASGVIGAVYAVNYMKENADGMEDMLAVIEINSCFADAVQYITGCTLGNNSLIFRDIGRTAFSLVKRNGEGLRLSSKPSYRDKQRESNPEFYKYFTRVVIEKSRNDEDMMMFKKHAKEASFKMLETDINEIFNIKKVKLDIPVYAPIRDTVYCSKCGEGIMKEKEINEGGTILCRECGNAGYYQIDGSGIRNIEKTV